MQVIKRSKMPDSTKIQIENWKEDYDFIKTLYIAAYPIAKESDDFMIHRNRPFRLELSQFSSDGEVLSLFEKLEKGKISLNKCKNYFNNPKDIIYL